MLKSKLVFGLSYNHELRVLDKMVSYGYLGRNRSQLLRAIIDVGVSDKWYTDVALSQRIPVNRIDCTISCRMDFESYCALSLLARRREMVMSKFVRRMIMACYYCDDYRERVVEVLNGGY